MRGKLNYPPQIVHWEEFHEAGLWPSWNSSPTDIDGYAVGDELAHWPQYDAHFGKLPHNPLARIEFKRTSAPMVEAQTWVVNAWKNRALPGDMHIDIRHNVSEPGHIHLDDVAKWDIWMYPDTIRSGAGGAALIEKLNAAQRMLHPTLSSPI